MVKTNSNLRFVEIKVIYQIQIEVGNQKIEIKDSNNIYEIDIIRDYIEIE